MTKEEIEEWWLGECEYQVELSEWCLKSIEDDLWVCRRTRLDSRYIELVANKNRVIEDLSEWSKKLEYAKEEQVEQQPIFK